MENLAQKITKSYEYGKKILLSVEMLRENNSQKLPWSKWKENAPSHKL